MQLQMGATSRNDVDAFPLVVQPLAIKAQREQIPIMLPTHLCTAAKRYRGFFDSKLIGASERERLQEIREMQIRYPVGTKLSHLGYPHTVMAVVPRVTKAICASGVPHRDQRYELHLRSDVGYYRVVTIAKYEEK